MLLALLHLTNKYIIDMVEKITFVSDFQSKYKIALECQLIENLYFSFNSFC